MEGVERTQVVIVCPQQRTRLAQCNPYAMDIDREKNCYVYGGFRYLARHYRNRGVGNRIEGRRLEYKQGNEQSNLKEKGDLIVFD